MSSNTPISTSQNQPAVSLSSCRKLLYMSHLALGDYVYQGPFLKALAANYPNLQLDIWIDDCRREKKPWHAGRNQSLTQWLSSEPHINHIYPIVASESEFDQQLKLAYQQDYDAIIYVATTRTAEFAKTALKIVNRGEVFGNLSHKKLNNLFNYRAFKKLNSKIVVRRKHTFNHVSDFYQAIFRQLFGVTVEQNQRKQRLTISDQTKKQCLRKLQSWKEKHNLSEPNIIFLNHLATDRNRNWKRSQLKSLIKLMANDHPDSLFILNTPPHDFQSLTDWVASDKDLNHLPIEVFTAKTDFFELLGVLSLAHLVISVETAIMHLASCLNINQIALIRNSAQAHCWRPLNNCSLLQGSKKRVEAIEPQRVFDAVKMADIYTITKTMPPKNEHNSENIHCYRP